LITRSICARLLFFFGIVWCSFLLAGLSAELSPGLSAEASRTPPTPATRQEVWQAVASELRREGIAERRLPGIEDLDLPAALPALAGRRLRVSSACWDEVPRRTQFRLECGGPGQCLSFLVYLHDVYFDNYAGHDHDASARERVGSCRPPSPSRLPPETSPTPLLRVGDRATAVFLSSRLRMTANVICLERGREGAVIRVRSQDGHVFRARISGSARVEALPQ